MALGAAGMAAVRRPFAAGAKKKGKNRNKKKGDVNKLCKTQVDPCVRLQLPGACGDDPLCKLRLEQYCQLFGTCDYTGYITCLID